MMKDLSWLERILASVAMGVLIGFLGILVWYVREVDLSVVIVIVLALGIYDFWKGAGSGETISLHKK